MSVQNSQPIRYCQHVKVDGTFCQAPPLNGRPYCRFHIETLGRRMAMARARARRQPYHLVLPIIDDLNSVHVARQQVMDAMASGQLDPKVGGRLLFGLQGMASDLRSAAPPRLGVYDPAIDTAPRASEYPDFEAQYDLPAGLDLSQPPEVVFAAEALQAAAEAEARVKAERSAYRSNRRCEVSREDIELEEILIAQGEEACGKRSAELERQEWKRIEQERQKIAQARQIVEAARRNERQWSDSKLREHYEKLWAEAAAKEKADGEAVKTLRAAAAAQPQTGPEAEATAASESGKQPVENEAGKKPVAAVSDEQADLDLAHRRELTQAVAELERRLKAGG